VTRHCTTGGLFLALLASAGLAACSSTIQGTGLPIAAESTSAAPQSDTAPPSEAASPSATASSTSSAPVASSPPAPPTPAPASPPPECPGGTCPQVDSVALGHGYVIILRGNDGYGGGAGASVVELTSGGVPVFWSAAASETPGGLACSAAGAMPNCVVVDYTGAHASVATVWALARGTLHRGATVSSDTPGMSGRDLNADGFVDVVALQNDYTPDYATGKVYWQTWVSDGNHLTATGCTSPTHTPSPAPTQPVSGSCP
jgi:hypothetical protein